MDEIIQVREHFYVLATSSRLDEHTRVLKHGDTFAVHDELGNIHRVGLGEQGLYHDGTRHLSRLELRVLGRRPLLLSSAIREDNAVLTVDLANPDVAGEGDGPALVRDTVHIVRTVFLWNGARYERIRLRNYHLEPITVGFSLHYEADFADIFEVRGVKRERRGVLLPPVVEPDRVVLSYRGLDERVRTTTIEFNPAPVEVHAGRAEFTCRLPKAGEAIFEIVMRCGSAGVKTKRLGCVAAERALDAEFGRARAQDASVWSSNEQFNDWMKRSVADLHLMITQSETGGYPYAGVPWFSTYFGRDGIITALEYLWINPEPARGVLAYLAATQATAHDPARDAEPGKILHERRGGEMANLGEIPFSKYYGSVDATPLFVVLAGAYYERTGDAEFVESLWPHVEAALAWIDDYGDRNGDLLVEYMKQSPNGLVSQGWKDSMDSVFHADGELARGPVALCEVQAYVYAARLAAARLAKVLGRPHLAESLKTRAEALRVRFEEKFWCEELSTYAMALDGEGRACRVRASNPGHCLFGGIVSPERAVRVAQTLLDRASFSGWGIRTLASTEARYNPMSYHNGSVWPHDNAIIAAGMARYGLKPQVCSIFTGLFDASLFVELHRMPELFCGFERRPGAGPTLYPVACAPQSWAAGAAPFLLASLLGLTIDAPRRQVRFDRPILPHSLRQLHIRDLRIGDASVDLDVQRLERDVNIELVRRVGDVEIVIRK